MNRGAVSLHQALHDQRLLGGGGGNSPNHSPKFLVGDDARFPSDHGAIQLKPLALAKHPGLAGRVELVRIDRPLARPRLSTVRRV